MITPLVNGMYNEFLYHLDLCILAYHLYHQTLIWPMDPFYEQQARKGTQRRENFMSQVGLGPRFLVCPGEPVPATYRGPVNYLNQTWPNNCWLDPVITDYSRLNPWTPSLFKPEANWEYIQPSKLITDKIGSVYMCQYVTGGAMPPDAATAVNEMKPIPKPIPIKSDEGDRLYCFEGGTGGIERENEPANYGWSMLGFVLVRNWGKDGEYDVHIAFRGSRSGSAKRALAEGLARLGNPDWVTDMALLSFGANPDLAFSAYGTSSTGFTLSMKSVLPALRACLTRVNEAKKVPPKAIYVTGHSLGGALAGLCAAALTNGAGAPGSFLPLWPWKDLRLITFSAPTFGDVNFSAAINSRVHAQRVYIAGDLITTAKFKSLGVHVGSRVELSNQSLSGAHPHDYVTVRAQLIKFLWQTGVLYNPDEDTVRVERCPTLLALHEKVNPKDKAAGLSYSESLPDFAKHLREYLNVFAVIAKMDTSYKTGVWSGTVVEDRAAKMQALVKKLSEDPSMNDLVKQWDLIQWTGASDVNAFLGLCLALCRLAKNVPISGLPAPLRAVLTTI